MIWWLLMSARETIVQVRIYCGAYVARGGGKSASCTASAGAALIRLAEKLGYARIHLQETARQSPSHSTWKITEAVCS